MEAFVVAVRTAIDRSVSYFLRTQHAPGYWMGELETNATITAEYLFFRRLLNRVDPEREQAIVRELRRTQVNGGWPLFYGGPPELNTTIEASVALQLAGVPLDDPVLTRANEVIRARGGLGEARVFTRIWLALLGALPWQTVPTLPPELMLFPDTFPLNIYRFASWARGTIVPLLVIMAHPPDYRGPVPQIEQFQVGPPMLSARRRPKLSRQAAFLGVDATLKRADGLIRRNPWRAGALDQACRWILDHQESDGGWGGIIPAMINSTLALATLGGHDAAVERGIAAVESFGISRNGTFRLQSCISPGWDTPWTMLALAQTGLPSKHPALCSAARWLLSQQSTRRSDWSRRAPRTPAGGWPFELANSHYPDTDDTALILMALQHIDAPSESAPASGLAWLLGMQNNDGGWAAFDRDNHTRLVEAIPFCDFGEVLDPSSADVTAHVLELLGRLNYGLNEPHVRRGLAYLWREQEGDGAWFGRWGVNYIYGTAAVLMALGALRMNPRNARLARAVAWLRAHQNADGGWGESCLSYTEAAWRGRGPSTASQTAWAVLGLLAVAGPDTPARTDEALAKGIAWLVEHQNTDGTWDEPYFTGTGFPGDFLIKYHEYRNYFPLLALSRAMDGIQIGSGQELDKQRKREAHVQHHSARRERQSA
jgi:squalene-hopene/tetraprenyl-beta-curcumene cyclase